MTEGSGPEPQGRLPVISGILVAKPASAAAGE
jgi:hypothetical protein